MSRKFLFTFIRPCSNACQPPGAPAYSDDEDDDYVKKLPQDPVWVTKLSGLHFLFVCLVITLKTLNCGSDGHVSHDKFYTVRCKITFMPE